MMTEDEAKQRWCPFARAVEIDESVDEPFTGYAVGNRSSTKRAHPYAMCLASACMAWQWKPKAGTGGDGNPVYYAGSWLGYCGLAGKE